jgi:putative flavoprotein involved in K+ transport
MCVVSVVVIGAGQAGLSVSRELTGFGVDHVVLERTRIAQAWRERWDSFTLVTPNWTLDLPGSPYSGEDPEGHVHRDEIVAYLDKYADSCAVPVREGVHVQRLRAIDGRFELVTSEGRIEASTVVVCTGAYQRPYLPPAAAALPPGVLALTSTDYRNPDHIPPGKILVVGSGQTGCQLTEELHLAGRDVFLSCGRAPWVPRRLDGTDIVTWLAKTTFFDQPLSALSSPADRLVANIQATGARGGHDLHYRTLQALGVPLLGHLSGFNGSLAQFADDLGESVAFGDARWADTRRLLTEQLPAQGVEVPSCRCPRRSAMTRFAKSTCAKSARSSSLPGSGPTTDGSTLPSPTISDSRSASTARAQCCLACTSAAFISCAGAARLCCSGSAKMQHSLRARSPRAIPDA